MQGFGNIVRIAATDILRPVYLLPVRESLSFRQGRQRKAGMTKKVETGYFRTDTIYSINSPDKNEIIVAAEFFYRIIPRVVFYKILKLMST